jgi:RecB family exonuclease
LWAREEAIDEHLARVLEIGETRSLEQDLTWDRFLQDVAQAAGPVRQLGAVEARVALREACARAAAGTWAARIAHTRGFLDAAARLIAECERAGITVAELRRADDDRVRVFAEIFARRERLIGEARSTAARRGLATRVLASDRALPIDGKDVIVGARLAWEPADVDAIISLARRSSVRVELPYAPDRPALYAGLEPILAAFEARAQELPIELVLDEAEGSLAGALYRAGATAQPGGVAIAIRVAATPQAEQRAIAAHARRLVDAGAAPEEIVVAARHPRAIARGLGEELMRVGLAIDDRRGPSLAEAPPARLALAILELPEVGFAREEALAIIGSRYVDGTVPDRIARSARALGVRDLGPTGRARLPEQIAMQVAQLFVPIEALPDEASIARHAAALGAALDALGVGAQAREYDPSLAVDDPWREGSAVGAPQARIERALARDQAAMRALDELLAALARHETQITRAGFAALLADLMAETPLRPIGARGGAVRLVHLEDLAGREIAHVIIPQLVDGVAPARGGEDAIFGERERRAINAALGRRALSTGAGEARTSIEELMLHGAIACARATVLLTTHESDGERLTQASPFLLEVRRAAPWIDVQRLPRAPVPDLERAGAAADVLARMALELYADPAGRLPGANPAPAKPLALYEATRRALPRRTARLAALARIERSRWRWFSRDAQASSWVGQVGKLGAARIGGTAEKPLSAGAFDKYANCPFTFFAERVLGVEETDEAEQAPDARAVGTLAHDVLYEFYRRRHTAGALPVKADDEERRVLERVMAEQFAQDQHARAGHPVLWEIRQQRLFDEVWRWIEREAKSGAPGGGMPAYFELEFGGGRPGALPPLRYGDVHVGGRIDRVDVLPDGAGVVVLDYKGGGRDRHAAKLRAGEAGVTQFQLPIYAAAARAGLAARGAIAEGARADGAFVALRDGAATRLLSKTLGENESAALLDIELPARIVDLTAHMRAGRFEVQPVDCRGCAFRTTCRVVALAEDEE